MEKVRVGVIGTGFGTAVQIPGFQYVPETEVIAVCSARRERAEAAAQRFHIPHAFTDYREMLHLPDLDLVSIVTPPVLHHEMTLAALEAGKHVLCEKPLAMNVAQAQEMYDRAQTAGVVHMVTHEFRYSPTRAYTKELIDSGYLGALRQVQITLFIGPPSAQPRPWNWLADAAQGGGILGGLGSHYIDALRHWFGEITAVSGRMRVLEPERIDPETGAVRHADADDTFSFMARFANGGEAVMTASTAVRVGYGARIEIYGSEGTIVLDQGYGFNPPIQGKVLGYRYGEGGAQGRAFLQELPVPSRYKPFELDSDDRLLPFVLLVRELVRGIREGAAVTPNLDDGLRCQHVLDAIRESSATGRWVTVPPLGVQHATPPDTA